MAVNIEFANHYYRGFDHNGHVCMHCLYMTFSCRCMHVNTVCVNSMSLQKLCPLLISMHITHCFTEIEMVCIHASLLCRISFFFWLYFKPRINVLVHLGSNCEVFKAGNCCQNRVDTFSDWVWCIIYSVDSNKPLDNYLAKDDHLVTVECSNGWKFGLQWVDGTKVIGHAPPGAN